MQSWAYTGRSSAGDLVSGVLEGTTPGGVADVLLGRGITPLQISPGESSSESPGEGLFARLTKDKIQTIDVMLFSRQLHALLKAGVPIMRALAGIQESSQNKSMVLVLRDVREGLDSGRELSSALSRHPRVFSSFYLSMVRVGEMTGLLDEVFLRLFYHLDFEKFMRDQVKAAVRYPTFVIVAMAIAIFIINIFVIPAFANVYKGFNTALPLPTQWLIAFSDFMVAWWPVLIALVIVSFYAFRQYIKTEDGRFNWDRFKLRVPVAGKIILKATLARFSRSLAMALKSGVPVVQALTVTSQTVDNAFIAHRVEKMREGVERGESVLRTAVTAGVFTPVVLQMVAVGEESGALDDLLGEIAEMYQREVEYELKTLSSQIEPFLIVFLGILVLILALGVFLPIWDLGKAAIK